MRKNGIRISKILSHLYETLIAILIRYKNWIKYNLEADNSFSHLILQHLNAQKNRILFFNLTLLNFEI